MKPIKSILAAGGDARQLYCAERLAAHFDISVTGFSESAFPEGMSLKRLSAAGKSPFDCVILPIPALDGEGFVNTPLSQEKLPLETIRGLLAPGGIVFAGRVTEELRR
ncbi:MAG: dipicolinate synthase subunit A, partial [Ruminococcus sp.]|nr:dipicolinate synthase subunit A [Ruminococcus sp.]